MRSNRAKRGQFIIIAVMLTAIMIVSIGALMHTAITYYKHEPWEEYSTLVGDIEINSRKVVELSLATYTNPPKDGSVLEYNLVKWQNDLRSVYQSSEISLNASIYSLSTSPDSFKPTATAVFSLNISSIGLKGYTFSVTTWLNLEVRGASSPYNLTAIVTDDTGQPVKGLGVKNFRINSDVQPDAVSPVYEYSTLVYKILYKGTLPATVEVWDQRGVRAQATFSP